MCIEFNRLYITTTFPQYIHGKDEFKLLDCRHFSKDTYYEYFIVNEILNGKFQNNIEYFFLNIHTQSFFDDNHFFIQKRIEIFEKIQRFYLSFSRLILMIKHRYKKSINHLNLLMDEFNKENISIIDRGIKYTFDYFELYKILNTSFMYTYAYRSDIINIRNPYTNAKFKYHTLINIYFSLLQNGRIPLYFFLYFKHNSSKQYIYDNYEHNIFIDQLQYIYSNISLVRTFYHIDNMIKCSNCHSFLNATHEDKIEYLGNAGKNYFTSIKIAKYYAPEYCWLVDKYTNAYKSILKNVKKNNRLLGTINFKVTSGNPQNY